MTCQVVRQSAGGHWSLVEYAGTPCFVISISLSFFFPHPRLPRTSEDAVVVKARRQGANGHDLLDEYFELS